LAEADRTTVRARKWIGQSPAKGLPDIATAGAFVSQTGTEVIAKNDGTLGDNGTVSAQLVGELGLDRTVQGIFPRWIP